MQGMREKFNKLKRVSKPNPRNIALMVDSYNISDDDPANHFITGIDIQTGLEAKVFLRYDENTSENRPSIADFADSSNNLHVNASTNGDKAGVVLFNGCEQSGKSSFKSNWCNVLIRDSAKSKESLSLGLSTVVLKAGEYDSENPDAEIRNQAFVRQAMVKESKMFAANQFNELLNAVKSAMIQPEGSGRYLPEVAIRIVDYTEDEPFVDSITLTAPYKPQVDDQPNELFSPEECVEYFLSRRLDSNGKDITGAYIDVFQSIVNSMKESEELSTEDLFIEVMPVERRKFGPLTTKNFFALKEVDARNGGKKVVNDLSKKGEVIANRYMRRTENGSERLYVPTVIGLSKPNDPNDNHPDYLFVTESNTCEVFPKGYPLAHLPTDHYSNENEFKKVFENKNDGNKNLVSEAQAQNTEAPKAEAPKAEAPKAEAPKAEAPKVKTPKADAPKAAPTSSVNESNDVPSELEERYEKLAKQFDEDSDMVDESLEEASEQLLDDELFGDLTDALNGNDDYDPSTSFRM
ncbi:hypothetical protein AB4570_10290 [Vibrio sp. 10N.222.49.F1]|uniref:hypothetical protein n=2 Tax=unclassified Vibrio TaxID=2614977 RepID=UPI00354D8D12